MQVKENPDDRLVRREMSNHGLVVEYQRQDGSAYRHILDQEAGDSYLLSEGLDPKQFWPEVGT